MDWINVMTYDFTGDWTDYAGHHSPLFASSKQPGTKPAFHRIDHEVPARRTRLAAEPARGGDSALRPRVRRPGAVCVDQGRARRPASRAATTSNLHRLVNQQGWTRQWDDETKNPWLVSPRPCGRHRLRRRRIGRPQDRMGHEAGLSRRLLLANRRRPPARWHQSPPGSVSRKAGRQRAEIAVSELIAVFAAGLSRPVTNGRRARA